APRAAPARGRAGTSRWPTRGCWPDAPQRRGPWSRLRPPAVTRSGSRAGRREAGAGRVGGPRRRLAPTILVDELAQRASPHGTVGARRPAQGDGGGQHHAVGNAEYGPQLVLGHG